MRLPLGDFVRRRVLGLCRGPPGSPVTFLLCEGLSVNPGLEQPLSQITHVVCLIRKKNVKLTYFLESSARFIPLSHCSLIAQLVKNPPVTQETPVRFLGQEDPLEKGWDTHSSILGLPW